MADRELTDAEFTRLALEHFGPARALELIGFCALWSLGGRSEDLKGWREELEAQGFTHTRTYRALRDLRNFKEHLKAQGLTFEGSTGEVVEAVEKLGGSLPVRNRTAYRTRSRG
jgi:hypothetical protein